MAPKINSYMLGKSSQLIDEVTRLVRPVVWLIVKKTLSRCFDLTVEGTENIPDGACILAANHASHLDSAALFIASGRKQGEIFALAGYERFFSTPLRRYIYGGIFDGIPVKRLKPDPKDNTLHRPIREPPMREVLEENIDVASVPLNQQKALVIFPEGTRSADGNMSRFKSIATRLAEHADCVIVPAHIQGTYQAWPRHDRPRCRKVWVRFGAPLGPQTSSRELRNQIEALGKGGRKAAFFDVDGTLTKTNVMDYHMWRIKRNRSCLQKAMCHVAIAPHAVIYFLVNLASRAWFQRVFYRAYRGVPVEELEAIKGLAFAKITMTRLYAEAEREIRQHLLDGTRVVFVTGTLPYIACPLAEHLGVQNVICMTLKQRSGYYTGEIVGLPISDGHRATIVRQFAQENGIDLRASFAYGDSKSDRQMLQVVGHPVAVNPDFKLRREAMRRGWQIKKWHLGDS